MGQIIGAIVAENRELAKRASRLVTVTYEDLLPVFFTIEVSHTGIFTETFRDGTCDNCPWNSKIG